MGLLLFFSSADYCRCRVCCLYFRRRSTTAAASVVFPFFSGVWLLQRVFFSRPSSAATAAVSFFPPSAQYVYCGGCSLFFSLIEHGCWVFFLFPRVGRVRLPLRLLPFLWLSTIAAAAVVFSFIGRAWLLWGLLPPLSPAEYSCCGGSPAEYSCHGSCCLSFHRLSTGAAAAIFLSPAECGGGGGYCLAFHRVSMAAVRVILFPFIS